MTETITKEGISNTPEIPDIDIPIAHRKKPRSCTLHPISKFVSQENLTNGFQAFVSNLNNIEILKNVQKALAIPEWRNVVMEEMRALKKNETWDVMELPRGKKTMGCKWGQTDHTVFFKQAKDGKKVILIVYVDDIILTGDNIAEMERLKSILAMEFEVKDLGQMRYFLGMEVARSKKGINVSQRKYVFDLLTETGMLGCKPSDTPVEAGKKIVDDGKLVDKDRYQRLVGKLIYLSHTRPDIAFAVSVASQHMHLPKEAHLEAVYKILRYLKGSPGRIIFQKD
ncbi:uncharacterized protein LOC112092356 [Morus notabilis]|uniref:uncharacterized protein LOC112092356 n=1 Tax=Morus notabilis TaxID=981085 RepID=UPI000CED63C0|nr:uncharacterized protein LOC112092356 [Morus notabilis]